MKFRGVEELANYLVNSDETHTAFVEQLFHYFVKQPIRAHGLDTSAKLKQSFAANQFNMRRLLVEITVDSALLSSDGTPPAGKLAAVPVKK